MSIIESTTFSTSLGLIKSVIPNSVAIPWRESFKSIPIIRVAPTILAPCMTFRPIPPNPKTATVDPGSTFIVNATAPMPVVTPHPM